MIDIGEVIGAAIERCSRILEHHRLDMHIEPELPMLELDPVLFEQALVNIFDNAAKDAPAGSTVTIDASCAHDAITVSVLDEGPGIPLAKSIASSRSFVDCGWAIASAPAPALASPSVAVSSRALGGSIRAANRPDRSGAGVHHHLPARRRRRRAGGVGGVGGMSDDGPLILVIDDEPPIRRLPRTSLVVQGFRIIEAESAAGALQRLGECPDLLILDLGLPDMDGIELTAAFARLPRCRSLSCRAAVTSAAR